MLYQVLRICLSLVSFVRHWSGAFRKKLRKFRFWNSVSVMSGWFKLIRNQSSRMQKHNLRWNIPLVPVWTLRIEISASDQKTNTPFCSSSAFAISNSFKQLMTSQPLDQMPRIDTLNENIRSESAYSIESHSLCPKRFLSNLTKVLYHLLQTNATLTYQYLHLRALRRYNAQ